MVVEIIEVVLQSVERAGVGRSEVESRESFGGVSSDGDEWDSSCVFAFVARDKLLELD